MKSLGILSSLLSEILNGMVKGVENNSADRDNGKLVEVVQFLSVDARKKKSKSC